MSIRLMAKDLYRAQKNVDRLQKKFEEAQTTAENNALTAELKAAVQERDMLRRMLEGEKESGEFRSRFDGFKADRK